MLRLKEDLRVDLRIEENALLVEAITITVIHFACLTRAMSPSESIHGIIALRCKDILVTKMSLMKMVSQG